MSLRQVCRSSAIRGQIRFASTESAATKVNQGAGKAAEGAKEGAQVAAEKAQAVAQPYIQKAQQLAGSAGALVERGLGSYKEPIFYNAAVAKEILKQVYVAEKLAPPSLGQVTYTYQSFYNNAKQASWWQDLYRSGDWTRYAFYAFEAYGIFKIGEMIGRRHVVGYKLEENRYAKLT